MKKNKILAIALAILITMAIFAGCSQKSDAYEGPQAEVPNEGNAQTEKGGAVPGAMEDSKENTPSTSTSKNENKGGTTTGDSTIQVPGQDTDRKLTYIVDLEMETYEYEKDYNGFYALLKSKSGFVYSEDTDGTIPEKYGDSGRYTKMTVKIPTQNLDLFLSELSNNYTVTSKTISMEDFTDKYFDVETRISLLEQQYKKYEGYLETAKNIDEILKLEEAMSEILYELDTLKGSKRSMDDKVIYSTVNISLQELVRASEVEGKPTKTFWQKVEDTFASTIKVLGNFFETLALFFVAASPVLLIFAVIAVVILIVYKCIKRKREKAAAALQSKESEKANK